MSDNQLARAAIIPGITYLLKLLALREEDTAPVTREVLRQAEADSLRRPRVHVGQGWKGETFKRV